MKLSKTYEPNVYESDIYALWEKSGSFKPSKQNKLGSYSIVMPPPNANADLHIGYELTAALEDIAARYHRLKGESTLLLPGADHAGFETWVVYEKKLAKEGKTRFDFTREELYSQVWDFVQQNKDKVDLQLRAMGASCDWDLFTFTLDQKVVDRAYKTFKQMWDDKLIYRGERLVNFCTFHGTSFSDIEVVYRNEPGNLWYINYPLADDSGNLTVATTRPETMLGDVAVAVNPEDKRYAKFVGKKVSLPLTNQEIPIIADEMVDVSYGTGAVKITPAHDPNDYDVAVRHNLEMITVISTDGKMADSVGSPYSGLTVLEAREQIVKDLETAKLLTKVEEISHNVGHCYKCHTVIQPLLRDQWFVDMKPLAKKAIDALEANKITFYPVQKKTQSIEYLKNIRDWNISRQIAWGIPIPAFQNTNDPSDWIFDERVGESTIEVNGQTYERDPDVFDTWFSSGQWPYITLEYPDNKELKDFYPLSLMETGGEILYPWVCRMIMLGLYVTDSVPFESVYIHGYVMAEDGAKMSKSVGNVVNPMPLIEKYGSDAVRIGIVSGRVAAVNQGYDSRKIEQGRNFCNKLWNVARYVEDKIGDEFHLKSQPEPTYSSDYWILAKIDTARQAIEKDLDNYRFNEAVERVYHLLWDDLADWYIEASKSQLNKGVLAYALEAILKLAHPFAPFVTETIWQTLKWENDSLLISASWPTENKIKSSDSQQFESVIDLVAQIRFIKSVLKTNQKLSLSYIDNPLVENNQVAIKSLAKLEAVTLTDKASGLKLSSKSGDCWLDLSSEMIDDFTDELKQSIKSSKEAIKLLDGRLSNKNYVDKAPKKLVAETKSQLEATKTELVNLEEQLKQLH